MKPSVKKLQAMYERARKAYYRATELRDKAEEYQILCDAQGKPPFEVGEIVESKGSYGDEGVRLKIKSIRVQAGCDTGWQVAVEPADVCPTCGRSDGYKHGGLSSGHFRKLEAKK